MPKDSKRSKRGLEIKELLLVFVLTFICFTSVSLAMSQTLSSSIFVLVGIYTGVLVALFIAAHLGIRALAPQADPVLLPLVALLTSLSLAMIYRLRPALANLQSIWLALGVFALILVLLFLKDYNELENYKYILALIGLFLLLAPMFFGKERHGARLWIQLGSLSFQPSEMGKILIIVFLAAYLKEKRELLSIATRRFFGAWVPEPKHFGPLIVVWLITLAIMVFEKDLGSSLLFFGVFLAMLYVATGRGVYVGLGSLLFILGAFGCYFLFGHVQTRIDIWLNPWRDIGGKGYQIAQSLFALANGSVSGTGLGLGYPALIPAVHTDFLFSAISEELGFAGGLAIIISYLVFTYRGLRIALTAQSQFGKLLATGLASVFGLQAAVIIGGSTKLIPLTGVTLPFMSYGGSSLVSNFVLLGLLLAVSNKVKREKGCEEAK